MAQEGLSIAEAGRAVDPRKKVVPGATPFVAKEHPDAPEYLVVDQPYFDGGQLHPVGSKVRHPGPVIKELGSPGRHLKPVEHQGEWPPKEFRERERKRELAERERRVRDLARSL